MDLMIEPAVLALIQSHLQPNTQVVLDFDDGVGPFSAAGICSLNTAFQLVFAKPVQISDEFDAIIASNVGDIAIKAYSKEQLDPHLTLKQDKNLNLVLSGDSGVLDGHVQLLDVQAHA